ncbi:mlp-like protein 423 [Phtheirospermum japonicum]|uniref:Mlp-like protein 423 n=1 Tax=Phtheirospermum japonicum TaxID=374723 RepID=A0A830C333_9LAMI|nr:mlp-like protein 423 [Phtheirospermum japonicum]
MGSKVEVEVEMKSKSDKVWHSIRESTDVFPKALSHNYKSIEVLEGDGKSAGSIRLVTYQPGLPDITKPAKEKVEKMDEANKTLSYSVIEGDVLQYYKNFKASLSVSPKGDGSVVKWWCEFDKASDEVPNPDLIRDFATKNFQDLDAYILANP